MNYKIFNKGEILKSNEYVSTYKSKNVIKIRSRKKNNIKYIQYNLFKTNIGLILSAYKKYKETNSYGAEWAENRINAIGTQLIKLIQKQGFKYTYKMKLLLEYHNVFSFLPSESL